MDQYVSWVLPMDQLTLEIIWGRFEDFCKTTIAQSAGKIQSSDKFQTRQQEFG